MQEVGLELALHRRDRELLGRVERDDGGGALQGDQRVVLERPLALDGEDAAVPHRAGQHRRQRTADAPGGQHQGLRDQRVTHDDPPVLAEEPRGGEQPGDLGQTRRRQYAAVVVQHHHGTLDELGELLGDLGKAATLQDDPHEHAVDLLGALQDGRLPVDDVGERLAEDVVEADVLWDVDDGKGELVGTLQHLRGSASR